MSPQIEFRIPISPTPIFFEKVHLFCAALRRFESANVLVRVAVGDNADLDQVRGENTWAVDYPVEWHAVPSEIFAKYSFYGTADYRYLLPESGADIIVFADADVVLLQPIAQEFSWMVRPEPCIAGHMAHMPPWFESRAGTDLLPCNLWRFLFGEFGIPWPETLCPYSMATADVPNAPAYYNLGFVVLNRAALRIFRECIFAIQDQLAQFIESYMRCQISVTLISYKHAMLRRNLPATFNAANDLAHFQHNKIRLEEIKVLHYLRVDEIDKRDFLTEKRAQFLNAEFQNPLNQLLQRLAREIFVHEAVTKKSNPAAARN